VEYVANLQQQDRSFVYYFKIQCKHFGGSTVNMYEPYSWLGITSHLQQLQFYSEKVWCAGLDIIIQKNSEGDISGNLSVMFSCSSYTS